MIVYTVMDGKYEQMIKAVLSIASEADGLGETNEPGCSAFYDLASELYPAIVRACRQWLPEGVLEILGDEVDGITDRDTDSRP